VGMALPECRCRSPYKRSSGELSSMTKFGRDNIRHG
jgi:hypothetical protein